MPCARLWAVHKVKQRVPVSHTSGVEWKWLSRQPLLPPFPTITASVFPCSEHAMKIHKCTVIGQQDWLYLAWDNSRRAGMEQTNKVNVTGEKASAMLGSARIDLMLAIVPEKVRICPTPPDDFQFNVETDRCDGTSPKYLRKSDTMISDARHWARIPNRFLGSLLFLTGFGGAATAQNQVYDPLPPAGSAYVRFVNAADSAITVKPDFVGVQLLGTAASQRVSPFMPIEKVAGRALSLEVQAGPRSVRASLKADAGSYVTVLIRFDPANGLVVVPVVDNTEFNQSRARLSFYSATSCAAASLTIDPDGPVVFPNVAAGTAKARSVNPVTAKIHASCEGKPVPSIGLEGMEAGAMYSVWLMGAGVSPQSFLTRDVTAKYHP